MSDVCEELLAGFVIFQNETCYVGWCASWVGVADELPDGVHES